MKKITTMVLMMTAFALCFSSLSAHAQRKAAAGAKPATAASTSGTQIHLPSIIRIILAASEIYPAIKKNGSGVKTVIMALATSGLVQRDMEAAGIIKSFPSVNPWSTATADCLDTGNCGKMNELLDKVYNIGSDPAITGPTPHHVLAAVIMEEYIYLLKNDMSAMEMNSEGFASDDNVGGGGGGAGSMKSPTCMWVPLPAGGGSSDSCSASELGEGLGDPSPIGFGLPGGGTIDGGLGILKNPAKFFNANGLCPMDTSKFGGAVSDPSADTEFYIWKYAPDAAALVAEANSKGKGSDPKDSGSKGSGGEGEIPGVETEQEGSGGLSQLANAVMNNELSTPIPGCTAGKDGLTYHSFSFSGGKPLEIANPGDVLNGARSRAEGKTSDGETSKGGLPVMAFATYTFTPNPMSDGAVTSACGGSGGSLGSAFSTCYNASSGANNDFNPDDSPKNNSSGGGGVGISGGPLCEQYLKDGGTSDPSPIDDGEDGSGGDKCGPSVDGKPSAACCEQDPNHPGCGGGENPIYTKDLISNPGNDQMKDNVPTSLRTTVIKKL